MRPSAFLVPFFCNFCGHRPWCAKWIHYLTQIDTAFQLNSIFQVLGSDFSGNEPVGNCCFTQSNTEAGPGV